MFAQPTKFSRIGQHYLAIDQITKISVVPKVDHINQAGYMLFDGRKPWDVLVKMKDGEELFGGKYQTEKAAHDHCRRILQMT